MSVSSDYHYWKKKKKQEQSPTYGNGVTSDYFFWKENSPDPPTYAPTIYPWSKIDDDDIGPIKRTWFQSGAFEDGYQFGDILRTYASTGKDATANVFAGAANIVENTIDTGASMLAMLPWWKDEMSEFVAKDIINEEKIGNVMATNSPAGLIDLALRLPEAKSFKDALDIVTESGYEKDSLIGEKSDSLAQSAGQLALQVGLHSIGVPGWLAPAISGYGGETEHAFQEGATAGEANFSGAFSAATEVLTEKLFGGIKFGGQALDDGVRTLIGRGVENKLLKTVLNLGLSAGGEGIEEALSEVGGRLGQWLSYQDDETFQNMFLSEEAFDSYIESAIGGAVLGGGSTTISSANNAISGRDTVSGLTDAEDKVVRDIFEARVADGKLTEGEKNEIWDEIVEQMDRGEIAIEDIERILGGDTYKSYSDTVAKEKAIWDEYTTLHKMERGKMTGEQLDREAELKKMTEELDKSTTRADLAKKLSSETYSIVKGTRLAESYNERVRRGEKFTADVSKYSESERKTIQDAIDSGILNNSRKTHEFVDWVAKVAGAKGIDFKFTDNEHLRGTRFEIQTEDGKKRTVNGYREGNTIGINTNSVKDVNVVAGHEITHVLEGTELYQVLQDAVFNYAVTKEGQAGFDKRLKAVEKLYKGITEDAKGELTADLVGEYLFTDSDFVKRLTTNRNLFQKVFDEVKHMWDLATAGSREKRELERVKKAFEDAYREVGKNSTQSSKSESMDTEVQHSLSHDSEYMDYAIAKNDDLGIVESEVLETAKAVRERIAQRMNEIKDKGLVGLPEDIAGNTYIANSSYDGTEENTTICPRSLASEAFVDAVSEYLGRPLTVEEQIYISQDLQGRTLTPECIYCYVATDRKAYRAFLGEYINQRDAVLDKIKDDPDIDVSKLLIDHNKLKKDRNADMASPIGKIYKDFLGGRKPTDQMYNRFKMWVDAYRGGKPMVQASHLANINKLMGDITSEFGDELKPQIVDAMKYAQSASWAKKRVNYVAYNGHILKWKQDRINKLNSHYGLRMYSFSDFHPAFVLENMQMITDASVRGLKMLGYTKDTDFVEIFAPTGMNINISTFGFESGGEVFENNLTGAAWDKARELRDKYPNVGITFVATNDNLVNWALDQDWIDVIIPYHLVRTGEAVAKAMNYTNYTKESSDTKGEGWKKGNKKYIAPTEHNNDKATYLSALERNHLKPRFSRFLDNPNYMKLVNECRQPASQSQPVQPVFNEEAANEALAKLEANGYYQPIGGSVDRMYEIAGEVAEAMTQELAPTQFSLSEDSVDSYSDMDGQNSVFREGWMNANPRMVEAIVANRAKTETRQFRAWFDGSKATNRSGDPLLVFHGTSDTFATFESDGKPIWFSPNVMYAQQYSDPVSWKDKLRPTSKVFGGANDKVVPAYIQARNVADFGDTDNSFADSITDISEALRIPESELIDVWERSGRGEQTWQVVHSAEMVELLKSHGFDSIKAIENGSPTWAVFESNQVKSAVANNGAFNAKNPDIRYSLSEDSDIAPVNGVGIEDLAIDDIMKMSDEEFDEACIKFGIYDYLEMDDDVMLEDDSSIEDIAEEMDVEPEVINILFRRSGLGNSHVEDNRKAVMTQNRINQRIREHGASNPDYARAYITRISPKDFIDMTVYEQNMDRAKFDTRVSGDFGGKMGDWDYEQALREKEEPPMLSIDKSTGKIIGHNGRHRMRALEMAGIESVEIEVEFHDEDGYLVKYDSHTIPDMAISSQFDTAIETHISNIIPLNNAHRGEIMEHYGENAHANAGVKYSLGDEAPIKHGNYHVTGEDISLAPPFSLEDIAPVAPSSKGSAPGTKGAASSEKTTIVKDSRFVPSPKKSDSIWSWAKEHLLDSGMVFEDLAKKANNRELESKWNFIRNASSAAQHLIGKGDKAHSIRSLKSIADRAVKAGKYDSFNDYLLHCHNIDRMSLKSSYPGSFDKPVFGDRVTAEMSKERVKALEKENPEFEAWAKEVYDYNDYLRDKLVESGIITQETADLWAEMYPHYVPIYRIGEDVRSSRDTIRLGFSAPVKRATGGDGEMMDVLDAMASRTLQTFKASAKNSFGVELMNTLGSVVEHGESHMDEFTGGFDMDTMFSESDGIPTYTVYQDGERVTFEITDEMYQAMKPKSGITQKKIPVLSHINSLFRGLTTQYNPVFALTNPIKDVQEVLLNSQHPGKTYINIPRAIAQMISRGEYYQEYLANGGKSNTYFDDEAKTFKEEPKAKQLLDKVFAFNDYIEMTPRLAEYIVSRESGRSIETSMLDAARVTTNFSAGGDVTKFLNRNGATFLNASVQGAIQQVRNVREAHQKGAMGYVGLLTRCAIGGLVPVILNNLMWDDDEDYENLADYVKQGYYILGKTGDGKFIRIPKGRTLAVLQEAMDLVIDTATGDDEVDFARYLALGKLAIENLAPNNPMDNNILAPITQVIENKTWYGEQLVPSRLADLPAAEQYDDKTDAISKWLGETFNVSPYKLNYLMNQYSGGVGDFFLPMLTPRAESGDDSFVGTLFAPLRDKFTTDSVLNSQTVSDFYDTCDELEKRANSKDATDEDAFKYMYMRSISYDTSDLYAKKREIQSSDLPDSEKYEMCREIQAEINSLMEEALSSYETPHVDGLYAEVGSKRYNLDEESGNWYEIKPTKADGSDNWYYQMEQEVTKALGISYGEYWNNREEYNFAYQKPGKYNIAQAVGGYRDYQGYSESLYDIHADKDENGKSINGTRKKKVVEYVNGLDCDYGMKIILFKSEYPADDTYNYEIIEYLNGRDDISYEQMESILKELGFTVDSKGHVTW